MKASSPIGRQYHLGVISKVINHICFNLDADLSLIKLADIAALSPFHFHRIFTSVCSETPNEFVIRKRIEKIAESILLGRNESLRDISLKYGFDNPTSFSRSFKKIYGISPSKLKAKKKGRFNMVVKDQAVSNNPEPLIQSYIDHIDETLDWLNIHGQIEIRTMGPLQLASIRNQGSFKEVHHAFSRLYEWAKPMGILNKDSKWLMVILDNPAVTHELKLMQSACLLLDKDVRSDGEVVTFEIPKGYFLTGHFELTSDAGFKKAWDGLSIWTMDNDIKPRDGHYFELFYSDSLFIPNKPHQVDICIPITKA